MSAETIGKYRLEGPLGKGRTGVVYRAVAEDSGEPVALKIISAGRFASAHVREKFLEEARAAAALSHAHLRQLYEVEESGNQVHLAMEYLEGSTLKNLLVGGGLEVETALEWGAEIAEALAVAHARGVVHGELTPEKIFITQQGTVKVLDAGLWRLGVPAGVDLSQERNLAESQVSPAALAAMAPEQIRGQEPDTRGDIFALGALLYEMTTGRNPFVDPNPVQTMHWVLQRVPGPISRGAPQAPTALDVIVARALEKEPSARFAANEVATALRAVAAGAEEPVVHAAEPAGISDPAEKRLVVLRLTTPVWLGIGAGLLLLLAWIAYVVLGRS